MTPEEKRLKKAEKRKEWVSINRDKIRGYNKAWRERNPDKARELNRISNSKRTDSKKRRENWLKHAYGLTQEAFDSMLFGQGGSCAICGTKEWGKRGPIVDHDHFTGNVRGILCNRCNVCLGQLDDNLGLMRNAVRYLESSR